MTANSNPSEAFDRGPAAPHEEPSGSAVIASVDDLSRYRADVWESDEELEAFLAHVRSSRDTDLV